MMRIVSVLVVFLFCTLSVVAQNESPGGVAYARALWRKVTSENRCLNSWDDILPVLADALAGNVKDLPIAICAGNDAGGENLTIIFDQIIITPVSSRIRVFAVVPLPGTDGDATETLAGDNTLEFMGELGLSRTGGILSARLSLMEDRVFINDDKGDYRLTFKATQEGATGTFFEFDCAGFQRLGADVEMEFSREVIVPLEDESSKENQNDQGDETARVKGRFQVEVGKALWNDFIVAVSLPPFEAAQTRGMGFGFYLDQAYLDLSEQKNHPGFVLPENYATDWLPEPNSPLWKGLYIKHAYLRLPAYQKRLNPNDTTVSEEEMRKIGVENLVIDDAGFTAKIYGENLMQRSDVGTKRFTVEKVTLTFLANELMEGSMEGAFIPPFNKAHTASTDKLLAQSLDYMASVEPLRGVTLTASVPDGKYLPVSLFPGVDSLKLQGASLIEMKFLDRDFSMLARLNGSLKVNHNNLFLTPEIHFEELVLEANRSSDYFPALKGVKAFSFGDAASSLSNFPVSISKLALGKKPDDDTMTGLEFDLRVNVMGEGSKNLFESKTSLVLWAKRDPVMREYAPAGVELRDLEIKGEAGGVANFDARLTAFQQHPLFGNGYFGKGRIALFQQIEVSATALWGCVNNVRYGYFDLMAENKSPVWQVPGTMGAMYFYGFGGGFYYKMKRAGFDHKSDDGIGTTRSGVTYVPDVNTSFGIKLMTVVGSADKVSYNGKLSFDVSFDAKTGGVRNIGFDGEMSFMTPKAITEDNMVQVIQGQLMAQVLATGSNMEQVKQNNEYGITGKVRIDWNIPDKVLHGVISVGVNMEAIKGIGTDNSAGQAVLHFDPKDWYIYLGTPDTRLGLKAGIGIAELQITSYFMTGNKLPAFPAPPRKLAQLLNVNDARNGINYDQLTRGVGFMFGGSLGYRLDDITFLMFYGAAEAEAGMDIMLRYFGPNVSCGNKPIKGWIAKGQAYIYLDASVGVNVDLPVIKGKFEVLNAAVGTLAQAEVFTTPLWLNAKVGGQFNILGGLVSGRFNMDFEYGEKCEMQGVEEENIAAQMAVIADLTPGEGNEEVNVFTMPQAVFNLALNKPFVMMDLQEQKRTYRIRLDQFSLQNMQTGATIAGAMVWNDDNTSVSLKRKEILPEKTQFKVTLGVVFEELVSGVWRTVVVNGQPAKEARESMFVSGEAPDFIPAENVAYSYPVAGQMHFLPRESSEGYMILQVSQDYLFETDSLWKKHVLRLTDVHGNTKETDVTYEKGANVIHYKIPPGLANSMVYQFELIGVPAAARLNLDDNIGKVTTQKTDNDGTDVSIEEKIAKGNLKDYSELKIFGSNPAPIFFRTSKYNTLGEKLAHVNRAGQNVITLYGNVEQVKNTFSAGESFDRMEIMDNGSQPAMLRFEDALTHPWFTELINPNIYQVYAAHGLPLTWRTPALAGMPPRRVYAVAQQLDYPAITESNKQAMQYYGIATSFGVDYNAAYYAERDLADLKNSILGRHVSGAWNTLGYKLPLMVKGEYDLIVKYVLPGIEKVTSQHQVKIINP